MTARVIEAGTAETAGLGAQHESASGTARQTLENTVPIGEAQSGEVLAAIERARKTARDPVACRRDSVGMVDLTAADLRIVLAEIDRLSTPPKESPVEREAVARIIYPELSQDETPHDNTVYRNMAYHEARAEALAKADAILSMIRPAPTSEGDAVALREVLVDYCRFAGETAGACLGLAMSTDHPAPDDVLMDIFRKSQALAAKHSAALRTQDTSR